MGEGQGAHHIPLAGQTGEHSLLGGLEEHSLGNLGVGGRFQVGQMGAGDSFREELVDGDRCPVGQGVQDSFLDESWLGEGNLCFADRDRRSRIAADSQDSSLSIWWGVGRWGNKGEMKGSVGNERTSWGSAEERAGAGVRHTEVSRGMGGNFWDVSEPKDKERGCAPLTDWGNFEAPSSDHRSVVVLGFSPTHFGAPPWGLLGHCMLGGDQGGEEVVTLPRHTEPL